MKKFWLAILAVIIMIASCAILYLGSLLFIIYIFELKKYDGINIGYGMFLTFMLIIGVWFIFDCVYKALLEQFIKEKMHTLTNGELHEIWQNGREFEALKIQKDSFEAFDEYLKEFYELKKIENKTN